MQTATLLADVEKHVRDLFLQYQHPYLIYHNLAHTGKVVTRTKEIAEFYKYNDLNKFIVMAAAWFHDTGHLQGDMDAHEQKSVGLMVEYLSSRNVDFNLIGEIGKCIMATKMPVNPVSLSEKIICDADTYHLGTEDFFEQNNLVKLELEARSGKTIENWHASSLVFMKTHHYYTSYCQQVLSEGKKKNIQKLISQNAE
jgi:predicted metal-dependent HD superfamily phosphohydrolase